MKKEDVILIILLVLAACFIYALVYVIMSSAASFSGKFYNGYDTLTTSTSLDNGNCNIDIMMMPEGIMQGAFHDITMHESGHSVGNASESMTFMNPNIDYSESFASHDRDTTWQHSIDSTITAIHGGFAEYDIKTKIESFALDNNDNYRRQNHDRR